MATIVSPETVVIDSPLLYWVNNGREKLDRSQMAVNIETHFCDGDIMHCRNMLVEVIRKHHETNHSDTEHAQFDAKMIGTRKTTSPKVALSDIFNLLDHVCCHDLQATFVNSVHRKLPPLSPSENAVDLLWLIENTKISLNKQQHIEDTIRELRAEVREIRTQKNTTTSTQPTARATRSNSLTTQAHQRAPQAVAHHDQSQPASALNPNATNFTPPAWPISKQKIPYKRRDAEDDATGFEEVHHGRRRNVPTTSGTAKSNFVRSAKPAHTVFLSKMAADVKPENIQSHLRSFDQFKDTEITVMMRNSRFPESYSSALVTFVGCPTDAIYDECIWPEGTFVKEWIGRIPSADKQPGRPNFRNGS
jgi:hypothetical protein